VCQTQCIRQKGTDDCSRSRPGNQLRGARRQRRLQTASPSSVNGPPLTVLQIQCAPQIETDNVQSSGSCIFSDTVQSSGLPPCSSLAAYNSSASVLAKKETLRTSYSTFRPCCSLFIWRLYGLVTSALPASIWSKKEEHAARRGRSRPKRHFFRENPFWCFEGSWERKCRWLSVQRPPSYFSSPSKFTAARYATTSQRCSVCLLANFLCALAFIHPIDSIEAEKPHQDGRRMPTSRSVLSANRATS